MFPQVFVPPGLYFSQIGVTPDLYPPGLCSLMSMFPQVLVLTDLCSPMDFVTSGRVYVHTGLGSPSWTVTPGLCFPGFCSPRSMFPPTSFFSQFFVIPGLCFSRSLFPQVFISSLRSMVSMGLNLGFPNWSMFPKILFPDDFVPLDLCSHVCLPGLYCYHRSMYPQDYVPSGLCSPTSLFLPVLVLPGLCSPRSFFSKSLCSPRYHYYPEVYLSTGLGSPSWSVFSLFFYPRGLSFQMSLFFHVFVLPGLYSPVSVSPGLN